MSYMTTLKRSILLRGVLVAITLGGLAACGGGGGVDVGVVVPVQPLAIAPLTLVLTRVGPEAIEVDWSDDRRVARFIVLRDGYALATTSTTTTRSLSTRRIVIRCRDRTQPGILLQPPATAASPSFLEWTHRCGAADTTNS
jgi:hypothetical protein